MGKKKRQLTKKEIKRIRRMTSLSIKSRKKKLKDKLGRAWGTINKDMDMYSVIKRYNNEHPEKKIIFTKIAKSCGISRQALLQLYRCGGKIRLNKYIPMLKISLPEEVFNAIEFPANEKRKIRKLRDRKIKAIYMPFTEEEKKRFMQVPYVVAPKTRKKILSDNVFSEYMHDKIWELILNEEQRLLQQGVIGFVRSDNV